ncbi:hypothetical protein T492DRAFT_195236 [Pavlovales sp. CCMP2436]|nr:hypothetical protein T492DRAFT_195236 [Pavlovales sp. CCMP2436]
MYHIVNASERPDFPSGLPGPITEVMEQIFERDTSKRPSARELLAHDWLRDALPDDQPAPPSPLTLQAAR